MSHASRPVFGCFLVSLTTFMAGCSDPPPSDALSSTAGGPTVSVGVAMGGAVSNAGSGGTAPGAGNESGGAASSAGSGPSGVENAGAPGGGGASGSTDAPDVTWHQDVAPLVASHCSTCHREGGIAPFSLGDYAAASPLAALLAAAVEERGMPPWGAFDTDECVPRHGWKNDQRLSTDEIALFTRWAELGAPEGDAATAASLPSPLELSLPDATQNLSIDADIAIDGTVDQFWCFSLDPGLDQDVWVTGLQVNPGNERIVHHVLVFPDEDGTTADSAGPDGSYPCNGGSGTNSPKLLGAWAPGALPTEPPSDVGMLLPAGSRILLNVHYHPTGQGMENDAQTNIDLRYVTAQPTYEGAILLVGNELGLSTGEFMIPAGATDHIEGNTINLPPGFQLQLGLGQGDLMVWAAGTHMHYLGVDMKVDITRGAPQGDEPENECLVQTPDWDFEWQRAYAYDASLLDMPRLRAGDTINLRCSYDNTLDNPNVQQALAEQGIEEPMDVVLGERTLDEMCLGVLGVAYTP